MASVLFVCWHNAARSQMAEAFFERRAGSGHRAVSAGTHASRALNLRVIEVMSEVGIDLSQRQPRQLTNDLIVEADVIVSCLAPDPDDYDWPDAAPPADRVAAPVAARRKQPNAERASPASRHHREPCIRTHPRTERNRWRGDLDERSGDIYEHSPRRARVVS
jgi:predicted protein tyrosine phosphatase